MSKKEFAQTRTLDFEITNILRVDIDALGVDLDNMAQDRMRGYVEEAWLRFLAGEDGYDDMFNTIALKSSIIPNSLTSESLEIELLDEEEFEED